MTVHSKILEFRIHHTHGNDDLKAICIRQISKELMLDENFWGYCSKQIYQAIVIGDRRFSFPGVRIMVKKICQDLNDSASISQEMGRALRRPISSQMVLYSKLPGPGFEITHIVRLFMQQGQFRRLICEEIFQMMIVNRHIAYDEGILPENHEFWRFSDEAVEAINHMHFFLMATNYPIVYDL